MVVQDTVINEQDYLELGLDCADICRTLDRVTGGKNQDDLSQSMCKEMDQLILWVKPTADSLNSLSTTRLIIELRRRSKAGPSNRANATQSLAFSA